MRKQRFKTRVWLHTQLLASQPSVISLGRRSSNRSPSNGETTGRGGCSSSLARGILTGGRGGCSLLLVKLDHKAASVAQGIDLHPPAPLKVFLALGTGASKCDDARHSLHRLGALLWPRTQSLEDCAAVALEEIENLSLRDAKFVLLARASLLLPLLLRLLVSRGIECHIRAECCEAFVHGRRFLNIPCEVMIEEDVRGKQGRHRRTVDVLRRGILEQQRQVGGDDACCPHIFASRSAREPFFEQREDLHVEPPAHRNHPTLHCVSVGWRLQ